MKAYERLLRYVKFHTTSDEKSGTHPSSDRQRLLGAALVDEMNALGISDCFLDENGYVYGKIPATPGYEGAKKLGFIAHMDTSPDFSGENVSPVIRENYDGCDLALGNSGRVLSTAMFPHLKTWVGRTVITTDGETLLGADDKAGIAEIMTLAERVLTGNVPHGPLRIAFTPDEEIGEGADFFDLARFDADFAYTVDGDLEGGLEYENFNAAAATFTVRGVNVHPGSAKDIMKNASLLAMEINGMLPAGDIPALTEGYEGFFHLTEMSGSVEKATLSYIVRDHDAARFDGRLDTLRHIEKVMKEKYGEETVSLSIREQYRNMAEKIAQHRHLIDTAVLAAKENGVEPNVAPIRGGTDGARLSFMGLPCPNLGTGGFAFHGPFEHISVEGMDKQTDILQTIVGIYAKK